MLGHRPNTTEGGGRLIKGRPSSIDMYSLPRASTAEGRRPSGGFTAAVVGRMHQPTDAVRLPTYEKPKASRKQKKIIAGELPPAKATNNTEWMSIPTYEAFDDNPNHTRNMIKERDGWRVERDSLEKKKRRVQKSLDESNAARRELRQKYDALSQVCAKVTRERDAALERETQLTKEVKSLTESNQAMLVKIENLEKQLQQLKSAKRPTLRDSDLLRQVKVAEIRIRELESKTQNQRSDELYSPLLTDSLLSMFDIKPPLVSTSCDLFETMNGKEWLQNTNLVTPHQTNALSTESPYKVTPPSSKAHLMQTTNIVPSLVSLPQAAERRAG
eukprot:TRINITY_DN1607_c4_g1_i1.p1 TRINITY_DN1607_c4_g1~~TRINITY_DN1607_c4_g1_i1.p1  ORF type:complete len:330 (+),score=74.87 TRINITY_DN1607_c4_g1_i1:72-1061(+)